MVTIKDEERLYLEDKDDQPRVTGRFYCTSKSTQEKTSTGRKILHREEKKRLDWCKKFKFSRTGLVQ